MKKALLTLALAAMLAPASQAQETVPWSQPFSGTFNNEIAGQEKNPTNRNWMFYSNQLRIQGLNNRQTDSYVWFPKSGLTLEAGHTYRISVESKQASFQTDPAKQASINVGIYESAATSAASTNVIAVNPISGDYTTYSGYYKAPATTTAYIGLNAYFYSSTSYVYFQNLNVVEVNPAAPQQVTDLTVTPDETTMTVALSFTAPTTTLGGEQLGSLSGVNIYRDGNLVTTLTSVAPGAQASFTDNVFQPGAHNYTIQPFNEHGDGADLSRRITLGTASPTATKGVTARYNPDGTVTISWPAPANADDATTYTVVSYDGRTVADGITATTATDNIPAVVNPTRVSYAVTTGAGTQVGVTNTLSLGNPAPFLPTFTSSAGLGEFVYDMTNSSYWQINGSDLTARKSYKQDDNANQDASWLITPGIMLNAGKIYRVVIDAYTGYSPMNFYVNAGRGNNAADMDTPVIESTKLPDKNVKNNFGFFKPSEDGQYFFGINATIAETNYSEYLNVQHFNIIEADGSLPAEPTDLSIMFDATDSSKAKLIFKAPTLNLNGTEVTGLTKIEVYKDGELYDTLQDNITAGTEYSVDITVVSGVQNVYTVVAYNLSGRGESAQTEAMIIEPPYIQDFNNDKALDGYTITDKFDAGYGWHLFNDLARCYHTTGQGTDAWLITPPIHFEAGQYYRLTYNAWDKITGTKLGVYLGQHPTEEAMTQCVTEDYDLDLGKTIYGSVHHAYFTVAETGEYNLGFHGTGPDISSEIYLDNIIISAAIDGGVPAAGTLEVIPDINGEKKAQIRFTIPTESLNGEALPASEEVTVGLYRNLEGIGGTLYSGLPGQTVSTVDQTPDDNIYLYSAIASNAKGAGPESFVDAFVGLNRPSYPVFTSVVENVNRFGEVTFTWQEPTTDTDGYPFNPALATYDLAELSVAQDGSPYETPIESGITGNTYTHVAEKEGAMQRAHRYVLRARNSKGEGSQGFLSDWVVLGTPFALPYEESFSGNALQTPVITTSDDGTARWGFMPDGTQGITAADGDSGYLGLEAMFAQSSATVLTPKVNLAGAENPVITLMVYNYESAPCMNTLQFAVRTLDGDDWVTVSSDNVDNYAQHNTGWQKLMIPISEYKGQIISLKIYGTCVSHTFTMIDKLVIREQSTHDLSLTETAIPLYIHKGHETPVKATVKNNGLAEETDYTVSLFIDGLKSSTVQGKAIAPGQTEEYILPLTISAFDDAEWRYAEVSVEFAADEENADNTSSEVIIRNIPETLAGVEALSGEFTETGIALAWNAPQSAQADGTSVTDDFENYESWTETPSPWLTHDADGKIVALVNNADIPGLLNATKSFWIFDSTLDAVAGQALFASHSGDKMIVSICPHDQSLQDDWLISPLLSGEAQTISFYARSFMQSYVTTFEVRASDGSLALNDFSLVGQKTYISGDWTEFTFDLPAGTRRFAIRNVSNGGFFLMVDDVTYTPASAADLGLAGYNVYYANDLLATVPAGDTGYTDATTRPDGSHTYHVTALYPHGESAPEAVTVEVSGLYGITGTSIEVTGGDGYVAITGANGMMMTLCTPDGRTIYSGTVPADGRLATATGVVIVKVGTESYKVTVK